jgi:hypothetical protein
MLDPDPDEMNAGPQPCLSGYLTYYIRGRGRTRRNLFFIRGSLLLPTEQTRDKEKKRIQISQKIIQFSTKSSGKKRNKIGKKTL